MIEDPIDETIDAFETLKKEGLIRHYGISSIRPNVIREYVQRSNMVSVMNQYSMLDRRAEETVLPLLGEHGIGLIARGPLAGGILTERGALKAERSYLDYSCGELPMLRQQLLELTSDSYSLAQLAIRYSLSDPAVKVVLPGASSIEQLRTNVSAAEAPPLSPEIVAAIRAVTRANTYAVHR
jgi:aryl-alcohol dehydrogenase-like predicted oxidoreductase